ncbi:MAG: hypothetical protein IKD28_01840, partial [Clostridia bacterium]|nr:hypothetical protein [Clostridia bacterium]
MDDKKKRHAPHRDGERKEPNGQRISVRPGNFTPPGAPTLPAAQSAQQSGGERRSHHGRNHHNRPRNNNQQAPQDTRREAQSNGNQGTQQPPVAQS